MTLKDILRNDVLNLPILLNHDYFAQQMRDICKKQVDMLKSIKNKNKYIDLHDDCIKKCEKLGIRLNRVITRYQNGDVISAYNTFNSAMSTIESELGILKLIDRVPQLQPYKDMYRIRVSDKPNLNIEELFHVPYTLRRNVHSYRFSIPGLPALYLGTSLYICWEELSRPSFDNIHVSKYKIDEKISLLNIAQSKEHLLKFLEIYPEVDFDDSIVIKQLIKMINVFLIIWPLIAYCHVKVKEENKNKPFKPEYIVPQILMQYLAKNEFDGVLFFSTRVEAETVDTEKCINIAIPAKKCVGNKKYCKKLIKQTSLTQPVSGKILNTIKHKPLPTYGDLDFELVEGLKSYYKTSDFGYFENRLNALDFKKVEEV